MACNENGVWNEAGAALSLTLTPAWFQTSWFAALCCTGIGGVGWLLYWLRVQQIAAGMNARFEERLTERTRIAQELHDTLLQGFLSASMQVHVAADSLPQESNAKPILSQALRRMTQVIDEGRNAVRGLRASRSALLDLERAFLMVREEIGRLPDGDVDFRVIIDGEQRVLHPLLRDEIYRIGREALLNAFRHSHARHIEIELKFLPHQLRMIVRDDGRGIDPTTVESGREGHWGLSGMRERSERVGGKIRILSREGGGTEIELTIPAHVAFENQERGSNWFRKRRPIKRPDSQAPREVDDRAISYSNSQRG
jgi:signal transduction histidine kinase